MTAGCGSKSPREQSWQGAEAHGGLGLVQLQVAHEVQRLQHLIHLPLALLCAAGSAEESVLLVISYLLPVALLQQGIAQHRYLQCTATVVLQTSGTTAKLIQKIPWNMVAAQLWFLQSSLCGLHTFSYMRTQGAQQDLHVLCRLAARMSCKVCKADHQSSSLDADCTMTAAQVTRQHIHAAHEASMELRRCKVTPCATCW